MQEIFLSTVRGWICGRGVSREMHHSGDLAIVLQSRMATAPASRVGDWNHRPALDGLLQPLGLDAASEALE